VKHTRAPSYQLPLAPPPAESPPELAELEEELDVDEESAEEREDEVSVSIGVVWVKLFL
jgi:hypothetical protein